MPKITVNDLNLYYEEHGAGEPLLLIYGLAGRGQGWKFQSEALAPHFRVITFDNHGVGETDQPETPYSLAQMADDAAGLLDALEIPSAFVFGISMGGMIAQETLGLRRPEFSSGLSLLVSAFSLAAPPPLLSKRLRWNGHALLPLRPVVTGRNPQLRHTAYRQSFSARHRSTSELLRTL